MGLFDMFKKKDGQKDSSQYRFINSDTFRGYKRHQLTTHKISDEWIDKYKPKKSKNDGETIMWVNDLPGAEVIIQPTESNGNKFMRVYLDGELLGTRNTNSDKDVALYEDLIGGKIEAVHVRIEWATLKSANISNTSTYLFVKRRE